MAWVREIYEKDITITIKQLGDGGFGLVYEAKWMDRKVAAKKLIIRSEDNAELNKELQNLWLLRHESIVELYGKTTIGTDLYLIMEYADCGSLHYYLHKEKSRLENMSYLALHNLMFQCARAVEYLHNRNPTVLHRDLKPNNLLLFEDYRILKICDFGTVREIASKMSSTVGTPAYIAPEVLEGKKYTEKCDVYSFGITLWEVMSRKKPFHHLENPNALAFNNLSTKGERPKLDAIKDYKNKKIIQVLVEQCWNQNPDKRPTMQKLSHDFSFYDFNTIPLPRTSEEDYKYRTNN